MNEKLCTITLLPEGRELTAIAGSSLYTLLLVEGIASADDPLSDHLRLERGALSPAADPTAEEAEFSPAELAEGWVLASQRCILGNVELTLSERSVLPDVPAAPLSNGYGMAFDVGERTIAGGLVNLSNIQIPQLSACVNSQNDIAPTLAERLSLIKHQPDLDAHLSELLRQDIDRLADKLLERAELDCNELKTVTIAASQPLCCQLLDQTAYQPDMTRTVRRSAVELGLKAFAPHTDIYLLPSSSPYLGADTVAAILAAGLMPKLNATQLSLLVDVDVSCHIVLVGRGRIVACTVPSEVMAGVNVMKGMPSAAGAIIDVSHNDDMLELQTVRGQKACGVSGAGLIATANLLLQQGIIDRKGLMLPHDDLAPDLSERLRSTVGGREFVLQWADDDGVDIAVHQDDINGLLIAKAAIFAACRTAMSAFAARDDELAEIILSESYCASLRADNMMALGFLPKVSAEKLFSIGNASWQGACMTLTDRNNLRVADNIAAAIECIDLTSDAVYASEFLSNMSF